MMEEKHRAPHGFITEFEAVLGKLTKTGKRVPFVLMYQGESEDPDRITIELFSNMSDKSQGEMIRMIAQNL